MIGSLALFAALAGAAASQQPTQPTAHWATTSPEFAVRSVSVDGAWALIDQIPAERTASEAWVRPDVFNAAVLDTVAMRNLLSAAPMEGTPEAELAPIVIDLPMPDGGFQAFAIYESPVMEAPLQAKYPLIRTYAGQSLEDDSAHVRITMTPSGFDAQIRRSGLHAYIDRYSKNDDTIYAAYYKKDLDRSNLSWSCSYDEQLHGSPDIHGWALDNQNNPPPLANLAAVTRKEYRLAMLCTGEYGQFHGGTVPSALAAIVTCVNRVSGIYQDEVGVKFNLVANNDQIVYTDPVGDGLSNSSSLLNQVTSRINSVIGSANYDVGHGVSTGSGGVAFLGVICTSNKGGGTTGLAQPIGDPFYVDYVAHEMGHQFGGNHTFNGTGGSCNGNRSSSSAYEIGSATTIMGYAGICSADNIQNNSDAYFHYRSQLEITNHITSGSGNNCDSPFATGNNTPIVDAGPSFTVPQGTPFFVTATGSDPDGDTVLYCWEQYNLGPAQTASAADNGSSPLFRSFSPRTSPTRYFPDLIDLNNGTLTKGEKYATTNRTLTLRCTARDNNPSGGGYATDTTSVTVTTAAGPFNVTSQSTPTTITSGQMTVTWNVANTNTVLGATQVDILFSTNAGASFDYVLATGVPNDGSETVSLPAVFTNNGRVMVQATGFNFFDMNSSNITIDVPPEPVVITFPNGIPAVFSDTDPTDILVNIDPGTFTLDNSNLTMIYSVGLPFPLTPVALVPAGGNNYTATIPAGACDDDVVFNFIVGLLDGPEVYSPENPVEFYFGTVVCDSECIADTNGDGILSPADFSAWVAAFNTMAPACDQNADGVCSPADFSAWVANYNAGCP